MLQNAVLIIIVLVVAGGIVATIAYHIVRFMRGSIKLSMPRTAFNPGDSIVGSFDLHTKKTIQGNKLIVSLIGTQVTKTYEDGKTRTRSHEIYRDEFLVEGPNTYAAGTAARYNFEMPTPNTQSPEFMNSTIGQALTTAFRLLNDRSTHLKWKLEARLDAQGVDLATSQSISLNIR